MIVVFVLVWGVLAFNPEDRKDWLLENALLVLFVGVLALFYRIFAFSNISYLLIALFLLLHAVGAHYAYHKNHEIARRLEIYRHLCGAFGFQRVIRNRRDVGVADSKFEAGSEVPGNSR